MKRTDFCGNPQTALRQNVILEVAQSESVGAPEEGGPGGFPRWAACCRGPVPAGTPLLAAPGRNLLNE